MQSKTQLFESENINTSMLKLAYPSIIAMLFTALAQIITSAYVGILDDTSLLATVAVVFPVFTAINALGQMVGIGASALGGRTLGKSKNQEFKGIAATSLIIGIIIAASVSVLGLIFIDNLANFIGVGFIVPTSNCFLPNLIIAVSYPFVTAKILDILCNLPKINIIGKGIVRFFSFFGMFSLELYCVQEWLGGKIRAEIPESSAFMKNFAVFSVSILAGFILYLIVKYFWVIAEMAVSKIKNTNKVTNNKK
jgi:hypothetical protein